MPESFLELVCPMAEGIYAEIVGKDNLTGAANYWSMVMFLRPYVFQVCRHFKTIYIWARFNTSVSVEQ